VALPISVGRPQIRHPLHLGWLDHIETALQAQMGGALLVGVSSQCFRAS
jgi:hypothetical protein